MKILLVTNLCSHYRVPVYEIISKHNDAKFIFYSEGSENYFDRSNTLKIGNFQGEYLKGFRLFPKFRITPGLIKYLTLFDYDCLILGFVGRFSIPISFFIAKVIRRKPIVCWIGMWTHPHSLFHRLTFHLTRFLYRKSDAVVVYGTHSKAYLESLGVNGERIFCAWNSVDNKIFDREVAPAEKEALRELIGIADEKIVLYVGRLTASKGLIYLLRAAAMLRDSQNVKLKFLLIGHGDQEDELKQKVEELGLSNVLFVGYMKNDSLVALYSLSTVMVLPSITWKGEKEPWGLVCNEAMIQGCPVIATDAVGAAVGGLIDNGIEGLVVKEKDPSSLAAAIKEITGNERLRSEMSAACKKKMRFWNPEFQYGGIQQALDFVVNGKHTN